MTFSWKSSGQRERTRAVSEPGSASQSSTRPGRSLRFSSGSQFIRLRLYQGFVRGETQDVRRRVMCPLPSSHVLRLPSSFFLLPSSFFLLPSSFFLLPSSF